MEKRRSYVPGQKSKIIIKVLREERTLNEIATEYQIHPNQLSRWKAEFLNNAARVFSKETDEIENVKKSYEQEREELFKQLGQFSYENARLKEIWPILIPVKKRMNMIDPYDEKLSISRQTELLKGIIIIT